jgi:predicted PhzF superfamily epimerase YddE/YHI9
MKLDLYQIDAFTHRVFSGNPAAVCPLDRWLPAETMQAIADENNLSETAFVVRVGDGRFELRWFTPTTEVDLCGHATLASAHVAWHELAESGENLTFLTRSGELTARKQGDSIAISLPRHDPARLETCPETLSVGLGQAPGEVWTHGPEEKRSYAALFSSESDVRRLDPDFRRLGTLAGSVAMATAVGDDCAFVSRFFAPCYGIDEDPVTGSSYCVLGPYWSRVLGRDRMAARQVSRRGGEVDVEVLPDRVWVSGRAVKFLEATISI